MIRRYTDNDKFEVISWFMAWKQVMHASDFPEVGLIEENIACGFLYQTDARKELLVDFVSI